jgi:hypothetical protein
MQNLTKTVDFKRLFLSFSMKNFSRLTYVGEPGGYGAGYARKVFYSNVAAPLVKEVLKQANRPLEAQLTKLKNSARVKSAISDENISRRFETLIDETE